MDKNEDFINSINDIFIEMNKGTISENNIKIYCKEHTQILTKMDNAYRCKRVNRMTMRTIENFQFNWTSQSTDNTESSMKTFNVTRIVFTSSFLGNIM